ncbi:MAG: lysine biosynthesis protein LysW [Candidatus Omnitrophica bacterium]|nr:lysine biosynthesis protein LysW [Candidatus Omnitrophota bacterium]MDD5081187.1 lysine biosynthesis protein LysW [Candidatus Omnitrophota bacterium]MDD5440625.1 lysine biosynthesis protein LysW [Candidatus Omnitrophota bacterium]
MAEKKVKCPVCGERFDFEEGLEEGDTTYCPDCYTDLKVVSLEPIRLEKVRSDYNSSDYEDEEYSDY